MKQFSWSEYYDKFYDWSFNTQKSYSYRLTDYGSADEVFEVLEVFVGEDESFASRFAEKALDAGVRFTPEQVIDMILCLDRSALGRMAENASEIFDREQLEELDMSIDDRIFEKVVKKSGIDYYEEEYEEEYEEDGRFDTWTENVPMRKEISLVDAYLKDKVVDIRVLNFEDGYKTRNVHYTRIYGDGQKENCRVNIKRLPGYYNLLTPKPIVAAEFVAKVHTGFIRTDVYMLFVVRLQDGTAQLIQTSEGSEACLKLLQLDDEGTYESARPKSSNEHKKSSQTKTNKTAQPYNLNENELPQGTYLIGRDLPAGTYDFFVVYGDGGRFDYAKYDENGKIINGTWKHFYWVGLEKDYEKRQLLHIKCDEGYTIKISGNVILKIAKSQKVKINL